MKKIEDFKSHEVKNTSTIKGGGKGDRVSLVGFGSFSTSERAARTGKH